MTAYQHFDPPTLPTTIPKMIEAVVLATEAVILPYLKTINPKIQQLHFMCAPADEVIEVLGDMNKVQSQQYLKYPAVVLFEDITVAEGRSDAYYGTSSLNLMICTQTQASYKSAERETKSFEPILRPILKEFKKQMHLSPYFANQRPDWQCDITERKRWGREKLIGTEGKTMGDHIDAITIDNLQLTLRYAPATPQFFTNR